MDTQPAKSDSGLSPKETRESICPHCRSVLVTALGRVSAYSMEIRCEYLCRDCSKGFVLVR
jgi:DNA-directed RNA polymerase subunit RPC12/RpoP